MTDKPYGDLQRLKVMTSFGARRAGTNPYITQLATALNGEAEIELLPFTWWGALTGNHQVFHLHWAEVLIASPSLIGRTKKRLLMIALNLSWRLRGHPVVRTVHNLDPREANWIDRRLIAATERHASHEIHLNEMAFANTAMPATLIPHGDYQTWFSSIPRSDPVPGRVGYVGLIRPYKGLESLIRAYADARTRAPAMSLTIAGRPSSSAIAEAITDFADRVEGITLDLQYVSDRQMVQIVTQSSIIALPYTRLDNSGAALAALSLSRPILVPRNATTEALADEVGQEWVYFFENELDGETLRGCVAAATGLPQDAKPDLSRRAWATAGSAHLGAYRSVYLRRDRSGSQLRPKNMKVDPK